MEIAAGERVLVTGPSGAGKSTLLRAMAGLLHTADHGSLTGSVCVDGCRVQDAPGRVGMMLQNPQAGIVADTVGRDIAFGLENQRVDPVEIWARVTEALAQSGFPYGVDHPTGSLSGGEMQRLSLAGSLVTGSDVLLLDEPTSMLDPWAADMLRGVIRAEVCRRSTTLVVVEHQLEPWVDFCERLVVLDQHGCIVADGATRTVLAEGAATLATHGVWVPGTPAPHATPVPAELVCPWEDGPAWVTRAEAVDLIRRPRPRVGEAGPLVVLSNVDLTLRAASGLAVTGASGTGKSTLVALLGGLLRPSRGRVRAHPSLAPGRHDDPWRWSGNDLARVVSWVPQNPEHGITRRTVREEVMASSIATGRDGRRSADRADGLLTALGLGSLTGASPYHLSGGEQRRLMVAAALAHGPQAILLDEPTVGQDRGTWSAVVGAVAAARSAGAAVALATHDRAAIHACCDRLLHLEQGSLPGLEQGLPR